MPTKKLTDKERILNFAFTASTEELYDAICVLKAAHAAKSGGKGQPKPVASRARTRPAKGTDASGGPVGENN